MIVSPRTSFRLVSPYYAFRPRFSLGLGLFVGYPVAFPYWYDPYAYSAYGYGYSYPAYSPYSAYPYPDSGYSQYSVAPPAGATTASLGGLSFDIQPTAAAVFIDGAYVGTVADFSPTQAPLTVAAGRHHIELRAQGCDPMSFDITVVAGQITPYQGALTLTR